MSFVFAVAFKRPQPHWGNRVNDDHGKKQTKTETGPSPPKMNNKLIVDTFRTPLSRRTLNPLVSMKKGRSKAA